MVARRVDCRSRIVSGVSGIETSFADHQHFIRSQRDAVTSVFVVALVPTFRHPRTSVLVALFDEQAIAEWERVNFSLCTAADARSKTIVPPT